MSEPQATGAKTTAVCESPEAFNEAAKGGLSAINALALLGCTLASAAFSLYADLATRVVPAATGWLAIAAWLATLAVALYLAGISSRQQALAKYRATYGASSPAPVKLTKGSLRSDFGRGVKLARNRPKFALLVSAIAAGAVFSAWSKTKADSGGVLSHWLPAMQRVSEDAAVIRRELTRHVPPEEQLGRLGITTSKEDVCRAINAGRADAFELMRTIGLPNKPVSISVGGGDEATCIEEVLLARASPNENLEALLAALPNPKGELDWRFLSQAIGVGKEEPVDLQAIARAGRIGLDGRARLTYVSAPMLMYAVWGGNAKAVSGLLKAGADANVIAQLELIPGPASRVSVRAIGVTPLAEAQRLGHTEIIALLQASGGRSGHSTPRSRFGPASPGRAPGPQPSQRPSAAQAW